MDVRFLWNHEAAAPLARSTVRNGPGSLSLEEDARGLRVHAEFANTQLARDLKELVKTGVVREMSFAWPAGTVEDEWSQSERGLRRTIHEFRALRDVSLVSFPAYPGANGATVRELVAGTQVFDGDVVLEDALRAVADRIHRGETFATAEERWRLDEAFASLNLLSPWMEERARRVFDAAASGDGLAGDDVEESREEPLVADRVAVGARERRHRYRTLSLGVNET
jgi:HK97 family phage prohead protease